MATLRRGTRVMADSGIVVMSQLGLVAIRGPYRDPTMEVDYVAGDTLVLLDYIGEGFFNAWYRGHVRQVSAYWSRQDTSSAYLVTEPRGDWSAHIGWSVGAHTRHGWLDMQHTSVGGADACG